MSVKSITQFIWQNPGNRRERWRRTGAALAWQIWKRTTRRPRVLRLANGVRFKAYPDCVVSSALIYADWPEYFEFSFLRKHLCHGELVIDVGANVGHVLMLLADVVGPANLVAFEPTPITFARLAENWQLNGWSIDKLFNVAVGATAGSVQMRNVTRPDTMNAVVSGADTSNVINVPLKRLDDFRNHFSGQRIGLLKIDVEGYELECFKGGRAMLEDNRPRFIMFESLTQEVFPAIHEFLTGVNYTCFELNDDGVPDWERISRQNLFAVPSESIELLSSRRS